MRRIALLLAAMVLLVGCEREQTRNEPFSRLRASIEHQQALREDGVDGWAWDPAPPTPRDPAPQ